MGALPPYLCGRTLLISPNVNLFRAFDMGGMLKKIVFNIKRMQAIGMLAFRQDRGPFSTGTRSLSYLRCALVLFAIAPTYAFAEIVINVDKTTQRLAVSVDGIIVYDWPVSTARLGYITPNGTYRPEWLAKSWFSRKYDMSPMPHSIFFNGGYAIHGSYEVARLGKPASHGCIRLSPQNATILFGLVQRHIHDTHIVITGSGSQKQRRSP